MPGAMPPLHRWLGNPGLSWLGRLFFAAKVHDFYCGLRGFRRDKMLSLELRGTGMEYALEQVVRATLCGYRIEQTPITLHPDGRDRRPHLRTWVDGWRSLRFFLLYSPRWLFLYPGLLLSLVGLFLLLRLVLGTLWIGSVGLDLNSQIIGMLALLVGSQLVFFAVGARVYGITAGFLDADAKLERLFSVISLEKGIMAGLALLVVGLGMIGSVLAQWVSVQFGGLDIAVVSRVVMAGAGLAALGVQVIFGSFFISLLSVSHGSHVSTGPVISPPSAGITGEEPAWPDGDELERGSVC